MSPHTGIVMKIIKPASFSYAMRRFTGAMTRTSTLSNPFALWTDLALQTSSMMMASAQVIQHRTLRIMNASTPPSPRDTAEFTLMGQEKLAAAAEVLQGVTTRAMTHDVQAGMKIMKDITAVQADLFSLANAKTVAQAMARNEKLGRSLKRAGLTAATLSDRTATMALRALKPIRSRAMANAKRLGKLK
jgi:hypothetical protein